MNKIENILQRNLFSGKIPNSLYELTKLYHIDLGNNFLIGTISNNIGNLINLHTFKVHDNNVDGFDNSLSGNIPEEICNIDDELKAIYHSHDCVCLWVFKNREDRNRFMDETVGMLKEEREEYFSSFY